MISSSMSFSIGSNRRGRILRFVLCVLLSGGKVAEVRVWCLSALSYLGAKKVEVVDDFAVLGWERGMGEKSSGYRP